MSTPGEQVVYYVGDLYYDRQEGILAKDAHDALCALADEAYSQSEEGHILLVQRRVCESQWAYIAVKRRMPRRRPKLSTKMISPTRWT